MAARAPRKAPDSAQRRPSGVMVVAAFGVAIAVAVALVVVAIVFRDDGSAPDPTPTAVANLGGIPQDGAVLGEPDAPVTLIEYADLQCPACRAYAESVFPAVVDEYVRPGRVKAEFRGFPFIGPDSVKAQRFVVAAGFQDRLWDLQEALYRNQGNENAGWVTDELLRSLASEIPGLDVEKLFEDAGSDEVARTVAAGEEQAQRAGVPGTPTFLLQIGDGEPYFIDVGLDLEQLRAALDDALEE